MFAYINDKKIIKQGLVLGIITIFTIILICVLTPLLLMGPLAEYPQYQFHRNTELDTEQSKKESLHTTYLNFDYSDILGCKVGVPPWDCGLENLITGKIEIHRNYFAKPQIIGNYYDYKIKSYKSQKEYDISLYICDIYLPYKITRIPDEEDYSQLIIKNMDIKLKYISNNEKRLSFCIVCDNYHGYKLQGIIEVVSNNISEENTDEIIKEILTHLFQ